MSLSISYLFLECRGISMTAVSTSGTEGPGGMSCQGWTWDRCMPEPTTARAQVATSLRQFVRRSSLRARPSGGMADAVDSKSTGGRPPCEFDSRLGHFALQQSRLHQRRFPFRRDLTHDGNHGAVLQGAVRNAIGDPDVVLARV